MDVRIIVETTFENGTTRTRRLGRHRKVIHAARLPKVATPSICALRKRKKH